MRPLISALVLGLLTAPASAELNMGDFNALASKISKQAKKGFQAAKKKGDSRLKSDIGWLAWDVREFSRKARDFKWDLQRLRQRAQKIVRERRNGREERDIDPTFGSALRRFVWDLERLAQDVEWKLRDAERIERRLEQGADVRSEANRLVWAARDFEREAGWLESEAGWAEWDIRDAGYSMEAWDIDRETRDMDRDADSMERVADKILKKAKK